MCVCVCACVESNKYVVRSYYSKPGILLGNLIHRMQLCTVTDTLNSIGCTRRL